MAHTIDGSSRTPGTPAAPDHHAGHVRYLAVGLIGYVVIAIVTLGIDERLGALRASPWYWLPAYLTHAVLVGGALALLALVRLRPPRLHILPRCSVVFAVLAALSISLGALIGWLAAGVNARSGWLSHGWLSAALWIVFQGVVVGWSEEYLFRGTLQRLFTLAFARRGVLGMRYGTLLAALLFGGSHLFNMVYQPWSVSIAQAVLDLIIGLILGVYYERSDDLASAAWLHNLLDLSALLAPVLLIGR